MEKILKTIFLTKSVGIFADTCLAKDDNILWTLFIVPYIFLLLALLWHIFLKKD
jgi:hypothetical protein